MEKAAAAAAWFTSTSMVLTVIVVLLTLIIVAAWKVFNDFWLTPKRLERLLRKQGLKGNPYKFLVGDVMEMMNMKKDIQCKPMTLCDDIVPRVFPFFLHTLNKHGRNSFIWFGPKPRVVITDPELIKDIFNKNFDFQKPPSNPLINLLATGLISYDGEKWRKHRRIINPAFNLEKLKIMLPAFFKSCNDMISKWEGMMSSDGSCEMDVWPFLQTLISDVISQTAFGSNYDEGRRIFELQKEQAKLAVKVLFKTFIPGWRFLPTSSQRRMKEIDRDIEASLKDIINKREKEMRAGNAPKDNLLGLLLESNQTEIQKHGNDTNVGMTLKDVIEECKLFYYAGQETTTSLLVWTMVVLSRYSEWQTRAREEVLHVFGNRKPDFDGLSHLKIVTMILYEVLRLYPPGIVLTRTVHKDIKLGNIIIPAGVEISLPVICVHHDCEVWGDDAKEFKPERFSEGVSKATNGQVSFFPFGGGPRICIGQTYAMLEVKLIISIILQHFSFELSPTYTHAPITVVILHPQYGAQIILHKL